MSTLVCTIELSKTGGMLLSVEQQTGAKQSVALDGDKIVITVSDGVQTSTIVQTPAKISVACKEFVLEADSISCTSKQTLKLESLQQATLTGMQSLKLCGQLEAELSGAMVGVKASGMLSAEAQGVAKLSGSLVTIG